MMRAPATTTDVAATTQALLGRIDRGGLMISETELRYQLRHDHAADGLLEQLADLEAQGLIKSQLYFRLTTAGEAKLTAEREPRTWAGTRPDWT